MREKEPEIVTGDRSSPPFLVGGGHMGQRMRELDWSATPLGAIENWPQSLRSAVSICLNSRFPIALYWGPELALVYNDAWAPIPGDKHPWALGRPGRDVWPEIWDAIGPLYAQVQSTGEGVWQQDQLLSMHRHGYTEECYFNFTFSPVRGENGQVEGIFNAVVETTFRVIEERRSKVLRELLEQTVNARTAEDACQLATRVLERAPADVTFSLLYLCDPDRQNAHLIAMSGIESGTNVSPVKIELGTDDTQVWRFDEIDPVTLIENADAKFDCALPGGAWPEPGRDMYVAPLAAVIPGKPAGYFIAGASPRLADDDAYRGFVARAAAQISTVLATVRSFEAERKRAEALAEVDRAKTLFFSNISHELRTPLTLMLGPIEDALDEGHSLPDAQRARLDVAHRNAQRLLKLVNSLLHFTRIEAGRTNAAYEPINLSEATADLASSFRSAIERAGLALKVETSPLDQPVYVDRDMWEKIVLNLLSNAFKFTLAGEISVSLKPTVDHQAVALVVRDTGVGVPKHEHARLFDRFYRVEGQRGRSFEGSGIGLALAYELVKLHGGTITVESEVDVGTAFTVTIPFGAEHLPQDMVVRTPNALTRSEPSKSFVGEAMRWLPDSSAVGVADDVSLQAANNAADGPAKARILVADDNADMRDYVSRLLVDRYRVDTVGDGEAALAAIGRQIPDLIVADVMMPRLDGLGLLQRLRSEPRTRTLPVILLSARAGEEARIEGLDAGADDYLVKPFSARELLAHVRANLKLAQLRHDTQRELEDSEKRFRHMADNAPMMVWVAGPDGSCTYLSKTWYEFTGQTPETGLGFGWLDAVHPDDRDMSRASFSAANAKHEPFRLEYRLRRRDGDYLWAIDAATAHFDDAGHFRGYIGSVIDISERKAAEQQLRQQAEFIRTINDNTQELIFLKDCEGQLTYANAATLRLLGLPGELPPGTSDRDSFIVPDEHVPIEQNDRYVMRTGETLVAEEPFTAADGTHRIFLSTKRPLRDEGGAITGVLGVSHDITEQKRLSKEAGSARRFLNELVERSPFGMYIVDEQFRITQMNAVSRTGAFKNVHPVIGRDFAEAIRVLWREDVAAELVAIFRRTLETGVPYHSHDFYKQRADVAAEEGYEWELHRMVLPDSTFGVVCYYFDSTELRSTQKALQDSETALTEAQRLSHIGSWRWDAMSDRTVVTEEVYRIFGRSIDEPFPSLRDQNGSLYPSESWAKLNDAVADAMETGQGYQLDLPALCQGQPIWITTRSELLFDDSGKVVGLQGTVQDITERKEAERTRQLLVDELNHRAKNMLAMVQAIASQSLRSKTDPSVFVPAFSGRIQAMARAHTILTRSAWSDADLRDILEDQLLLGQPDPRISMSGPPVMLAAQQVIQLGLTIHELGTNARKYGALSSEDGKLTIEWAAQTNDIRELIIDWREDNPRPILKAGAGGGFGSKLVRAITAGGKAEMKTSARGISWDIRIPLADVQPRQRGQIRSRPFEGPRAGATIAIEGRRVLVVEDEALIGLELQAILEGAGAVVLGPARSVDDALSLIRKEEIDAVLLDMNLSGEPVDEIAAALTRRGVPFAFLTGYGREAMPRDYAAATLLNKPFMPAQVLATLHSLLHPSDSTVVRLSRRDR